MKRTGVIAAVVSAAALMASAAAQAASVEIKFFPDPNSSGYSTAPMVFSNGGISVSAQGQSSSDGGATWSAAGMDSFVNLGLAIRAGSGDDTHQIDGNGVDERVLLSFSETVTLESAKFTYVSGDDQFAFWTFDPDMLVDGNIDIPNSDGNVTTINIYDFLNAWVGDVFAIGALGGNDDFKLYSVTVSETEVPVPGTLGLLGLGLAGLGLVRRRQTP